MPKKIAIYLNLLYSRADTGHFFRRTSATLFTDSAGDVTTSVENKRMILIIEIMVADIFTPKVNQLNYLKNCVFYSFPIGH
jgi:hypothetical protein